MMWNNIGLKHFGGDSHVSASLRMMWNNIGLKPRSPLVILTARLRMMWNNIGLKHAVSNNPLAYVWEWCEII